MSSIPIKPNQNRFLAAVDGFREYRPRSLRNSPQIETPSRGSNEVLLLEDDSDFSAVLVEFLRENGFQVVAVRNGVEGIREVLQSDFEVILCDLMMPALCGDTFFRAVGRMRPHLCERFIFMTGHYGSQNVKRLAASANNAILAKPLVFSELAEQIAFVSVRNIHLAA